MKREFGEALPDSPYNFFHLPAVTTVSHQSCVWCQQSLTLLHCRAAPELLVWERAWKQLLLPCRWLWDALFNNKVRLRFCVGLVLVLFVCIFKLGQKPELHRTVLKETLQTDICVQRGKHQRGKVVWYLWIMVRKTLLMQTFPGVS